MSEPVKVTLTTSEMASAAYVGMRRRISAIRDGQSNRHGFDGIGWDEDIEGAAGECAVARAIDRYWEASVGFSKGSADVGNIQVRTTEKHGNRLIIRNNDNDSSVFVLVTGRAPSFRVIGWILGRDAKRSEWLDAPNDRPPAWFVPQSALHPMERLKNRGDM